MADLLKKIQSYGVSVSTDGRLVIVTPIANLPSDVLAEAKANKAQLIRELVAAASDLPPLTIRQIAGINEWLDYTGETVLEDRQAVLDDCQQSEWRRAGYFREIRNWMKTRERQA